MSPTDLDRVYTQLCQAIDKSRAGHRLNDNIPNSELFLSMLGLAAISRMANAEEAIQLIQSTLEDCLRPQGSQN
jgi:hypothetical protein